MPPIVISEQRLEEIVRDIPEMPGVKAERFMSGHGLTREEALQMSSEWGVARNFEALLVQGASPRIAAQWIGAQLLPMLKERQATLESISLEPARFASLLLLLEREEINANAAREVLRKLFESPASPGEIVDQCGYRQVSEEGRLEALVDQVLLEHPSAVENLRKGASKTMGFLMGQAMQASGGKANPRMLKELLAKKTSGQ